MVPPPYCLHDSSMREVSSGAAVWHLVAPHNVSARAAHTRSFVLEVATDWIDSLSGSHCVISGQKRSVVGLLGGDDDDDDIIG